MVRKDHWGEDTVAYPYRSIKPCRNTGRPCRKTGRVPRPRRRCAGPRLPFASGCSGFLGHQGRIRFAEVGHHHLEGIPDLGVDDSGRLAKMVQRELVLLSRGRFSLKKAMMLPASRDSEPARLCWTIFQWSLSLPGRNRSCSSRPRRARKNRGIPRTRYRHRDRLAGRPGGNVEYRPNRRLMGVERIHFDHRATSRLRLLSGKPG